MKEKQEHEVEGILVHLREFPNKIHVITYFCVHYVQQIQ